MSTKQKLMACTYRNKVALPTELNAIIHIIQLLMLIVSFFILCIVCALWKILFTTSRGASEHINSCNMKIKTKTASGRQRNKFPKYVPWMKSNFI